MLKTVHKKPILILGSRHGSIQNLTPANLPQIQGVQLSFGDFFDYKQTLRSLPQGMSFKKFLGFKQQTLTYLTPYDFYKPQPITGCQNSKQVKIKCANGYNTITAQQYDEVVEIIRPDILVTLTQYPSLSKDHKEESNKSYKRAITKTTTYLEQSKLWKKREEVKGETKEGNEKKIGLRLAALHGAKNSALLARSLEQCLEYDVDGFVVCDVCESETLEERQVIYNHIKERLEQQKRQYVLCLAGQGRIEDISHALSHNFTHFQVSYPFTLAQNHLALIKCSQTPTYTQHTPIKHQNLQPLDKSCKCQTCQRHSQSYIAHLIQCHEMTANVLLAIHNLHQYQEWLEKFDSMKNQ